MNFENKIQDALNLRKIEEKKLKYAEIAKPFLEMEYEDFLACIAAESDDNVMRDIWAALVSKLEEHQKGTEERGRIGQYVSAAYARLKEIKSQSKEELSDKRALTYRKEK